MYFYDEENNCVGITKKGDEIRDDVEYISKAAYLKKKKEIEAEQEEVYEDVKNEKTTTKRKQRRQDLA